MKKHQTPASPKADANTGFKLGFDSEAAFVIGPDGEKYDGTEGDLANMVARYIEQERIERERLFDGLKRAAEFQGKCEDDAAEFVALYWSGYDGKSNTLCLEKFERWLQDHERRARERWSLAIRNTSPTLPNPRMPSLAPGCCQSGKTGPTKGRARLHLHGNMPR